MKSFKRHISEVAQPQSAEEKKFKDQHTYVVNKHPVALDHQHTGETAKPKAKRKADREGDANYDKAYNESVEELDEISRDTARSYIRKAAADNKERKTDVMKPLPIKDMEKNISQFKKMKSREKGIKTAGDRLTKESIEVEEGIMDKARDIRKKVFGKTDAEKRAEQERAAMAGFHKVMSKAADGMTKKRKNEEVEQLDELSPETLNRYKKKSMDDESKRTVKHYDAVFGVKGKKPSWDDTQKALRKIKNRVKGRKRANKQLGFDNNLYHDGKKLTNEKTESAAMDRARYDADDAAAPKKKVTLAKAPWDKNEELSDKQKKIDHNKNGKIDGHDLAMIRKKKNEEVELDEAAYLKGDLAKRADAHEDQADHHNREAEKAHKAGDKLASTTHAAAARAHMKAAGVIDRHLEKPRHLRPDTAPTGSARAAHKATQKANSLDEGILAEEGMVKPVPFKGKTSDEKSAHKLLTKVGLVHGKIADHHEPSHIHPKTGTHVKIMRNGKAFAASKANGQTIVPPTHIDKLGSWLHDSGHDKSMKEEVEVTETTMSAVKKPVNMTGPDGKTRTVMKTTKDKRTDDHGQDQIKTNEEVEINEAYTQGIIKLNDKSSVVLKKEDAEALNKLFKGMSAASKKKMTETAMANKKGFAEILEFAREAL